MDRRRKRSSLDRDTTASEKITMQQIHPQQQINQVNQQEPHIPSSGQRFHQESNQYQDPCEETANFEEKESTRNAVTSVVEDIKPELIQHGNNNNNEEESNYCLDKRILRSSLIVSTASNDGDQTPPSGSNLSSWTMNVDGQTSGPGSDTNPRPTPSSDTEVSTVTSLHNQSLIQQIGGISFGRSHDPASGGASDGLLGSGSQQQSHHLSDNIQHQSHHQNIAVDDEIAGSNSVGVRNQNRYIRDYHTLSSAHHHLGNPQGLPPPPPSHHPQDLHAAFDHLGGSGGDQESFGDRYQTRPVDLGYSRSGGAGTGPYSPQGGQAGPESWAAPAAAHQLLAQDYFTATDGRHHSAVAHGNPLVWPTPSEHQGNHHHHHHHRFGSTMGHPHAAVAAAAVQAAAAATFSTSSSLSMVGGGGGGAGRPESALSGKSKLCSPTSYRLG